MKNGMVLEGGGMRGMYTAGVLDVFMENGVKLDGVVGVSAGAVFGCNYKSGQIGRSIRYNMKFCKDPRYGSIRSWLKTGNIFDEEFCYHELPLKLDVFDKETFKNNPMEFYACCTDARTGKAVYHLCSDGDEKDIRWMQASASLPFVSKAVKIDGDEYLDGGIADSIPVKWMLSQGYDKCVVVLTRVEGYVKKPNKTLGIIKHFMKKYPEVIKAMGTRHTEYNKTIAEIKKLEKEGKIFVIRPSRLVKISKTESNPAKLKEMYELGREDAKMQLEKLRTFLN